VRGRTKLWRVVLPVAGVWCILVATLWSVERAHASSTIQSFGEAAWYSLVTLTTVGYGDEYPVTAAGKVIGTVFLLGSLGVLGVLVYKVSERISDIRERRKMGYNGTRFRNHVLILGWDDFARAVARQLMNADVRVGVVTDRKDDVDLIREQLPKDNTYVLFADLKDPLALEKANIREAGMVFPNLATDTEKLIAILNIKREYPETRFVVTLDNEDLKGTFRTAGVTFVLSRGEIAAKMVASYIFEPDVAEYETDLLASAKEADEYDIQQFRITAKNPFAGRTYGEAFGTLKAEHNVVLIGIVKGEKSGRRLIKLPDDAITVETGDSLIMIVNGDTEKVVSRLFGTAEGILPSGD
jgi:voltage-gated potassium channel